MSKQYPGGLITKSPVVPSGPYEDSSASGIWTLDQQAYWRKLNQWPIAGSVQPDPQFNYVTMLLHGDGTNGAQNNTFLDSSTNNYTITRYGNTTQGSFSPYGSNWSNYFDGSSYLSSTVTSLSGQFTIEFMYYSTTSGTNYGMTFGDSNTSTGLEIYQSGGVIKVYSNNAFQITGTSGSSNSWIHVALTRDGSNNIKLYVNGAQQGSTWVSSATFSSTLQIGVEYYSAAITGYLSGYISNFRILNVTSTPTVPTAPLTAISGTTFLTCQSNRFIDNSANNYTITKTGTPSVQRFNPFGTSTAYSTSVIGGSAYYDSSGDSLSTPASSANNPQSGDDYTVEAWIYITVVGGVTTIYSGNSVGYFAYRSAGRFEFVSSSLELRLTFPVPLNQWCHAAVTRQSGTVRMFINGALTSPTVASGSATGNTDTLVGASTVYYFGSYTDSTSGPFGGYISNFRIVKGTAVYTAAFTPPTAPLTAVTNTAILLNNINGAIFDNAMINNLETAGNAQISTSVVKYGTGSMYFNGTNNCCLTTQSAMSSSGPFTFECWAYWNDTGLSTDMGMLCSQYASSQSGRMLFGSQSGALVLRVDGGTVYLTTSVSTGTWYFVAWTFDGTTHRLFLNGTLASSSTSVPALYTGVNTSIGGQPDSLLADYCLDGYMDEVRITKGVARYTATFTPPTSAFPNIGPN